MSEDNSEISFQSAKTGRIRNKPFAGGNLIKKKIGETPVPEIPGFVIDNVQVSQHPVSYRQAENIARRNRELRKDK